MSDNARPRAGGALPDVAQLEIPVHMLPDIGMVLAAGRVAMLQRIANGETDGELVPGQIKAMVDSAHRFEQLVMQTCVRLSFHRLQEEAQELRRADPTLTVEQAAQRAFNNAVNEGAEAIKEEVERNARRASSGPEIVLPPHTGLKS